MTKRDYYEKMQEIVKEKTDIIGNDKAVDLLKFLEKEKAMSVKKKGGKGAENYEKNEKLKAGILAEMEAGRLYGMKEMYETLPCLQECKSLQHLNAIIVQLKNSGKIIREVSKGKALFRLPVEETETEE